MNRNELIQYIQQEYICDLDNPWEKYPNYVVIRRKNNQKWFALIVRRIGMTKPPVKLGVSKNS